MKRSVFSFFLILLAGAIYCGAQVAPSATGREFRIDAGGMGSLFSPDYGPNRLAGVGAYVDLRFTRWVQVEAEGRWLRYNQYANIYQDNYLIGLREPIHTFWKATPYGKVLVGQGRMNFQYNYASGTFTDIAYGGGVDIKMNNRLTLRAFDFEYQQWPKWLPGEGGLYPYGGSVGIAYRVW